MPGRYISRSPWAKFLGSRRAVENVMPTKRGKADDPQRLVARGDLRLQGLVSDLIREAGIVRLGPCPVPAMPT